MGHRDGGTELSPRKQGNTQHGAIQKMTKENQWPQELPEHREKPPGHRDTPSLSPHRSWHCLSSPSSTIPAQTSPGALPAACPQAAALGHRGRLRGSQWSYNRRKNPVSAAGGGCDSTSPAPVSPALSPTPGWQCPLPSQPGMEGTQDLPIALSCNRGCSRAG